MSITPAEAGMTRARCNPPRRRLDFLAEPVVSEGGAGRDGGIFRVDRPWGSVSFGEVTLKRGWWKFECEGEGDLAGVELRLPSPAETLICFSPSRASGGRVLLRSDTTVSVSLLLSPWPGKVHLNRLRLRQLSLPEQMLMAGMLFRRLLRADRPFAKLLHIATRFLGGRMLRIQPGASERGSPGQACASAQTPGKMRTLREGEITAVFRSDDSLHPQAMAIAAAAFERSAGLRAIYADRWEGDRLAPLPEWDRDLAMACAFVDAPVFFRGRTGPDDAWGRLLQLSDQPRAVGRIPLPLARRDGPVVRAPVSAPAPGPGVTPRVSLVVPTKLQMDLLERCLRGLAHQTAYRDLEVIIVDNGADARRLGMIMTSLAPHLNLIRLEDRGPFNFSRLINAGVRRSQGDVIVLLNDDVEPVESDWLNRMVGSAMADDVGCVGARLLYPDRTIQHAGVMLGLSGVCGHLWKGLSEEEARTIPQIMMPGGRMAVTGACLAVRRDIFDTVGGLDEKAFAVAFNDVDFCLRVREAGYRTIYRGDAVLIHHESQSRGPDDETAARRRRLARETATFLDRWKHLLDNDPFGSPAYDPTVETGAIHPSLKPF